MSTPIANIFLITYYEAMDKLIAYIKSHSPKALAREIGISRQALDKWKMGHTQPSPLRAADIARATHGEVTRSDLWPDLWPPA